MFGASCPQRQTGSAVVMQSANTQEMQHHLNEISANITLLSLPPRPPELNPAENG